MAENFLGRLFHEMGSLLQSFRDGAGTTTKKPKRAHAFSPYVQSITDEGRWGHQAGIDIAYQEMAQKRALQSSWVYIAVGLISREASAAEFQITDYKENEEGNLDLSHPFIKLLRKPNPSMGRAFLWQYTHTWLQLSGNAYWFIVTDEDGTPIEVWPLPSYEIEPVPGTDEKLIGYYEYRSSGKIYQIPAEFICHMRLPNPFDMFRGMSPLVAAMMAVDTDNAMSLWNTNFFNRDNVMPSAIINITSGDPNVPIADEDIDALKEDLRDDYAAFRRKTAILTAGTMQVEKLEWSPFELDFKGSREFTRKEIFQIYGIPEGMLDNGAASGNGSRMVDQVIKEKTIWPLLVLISEQITAQIIIPFYSENQEALFKDIRPVNRQLELQELSAATNWLTIDEIRKKFWKLDPLPNGRGARLSSEPPIKPPDSSTPAKLQSQNKQGESDEGNRITPEQGALPGQPSLSQLGYEPSTAPKAPTNGKPPTSSTPLDKLIGQ